MSQFGVALLFLYRNLIYLALISAIISVLLVIFGQLYQKPFLEHMKQSQSEEYNVCIQKEGEFAGE